MSSKLHSWHQNKMSSKEFTILEYSGSIQTPRSGLIQTLHSGLIHTVHSVLIWTIKT